MFSSSFAVAAGSFNRTVHQQTKQRQRSTPISVKAVGFDEHTWAQAQTDHPHSNTTSTPMLTVPAPSVPVVVVPPLLSLSKKAASLLEMRLSNLPTSLAASPPIEPSQVEPDPTPIPTAPEPSGQVAPTPVVVPPLLSLSKKAASLLEINLLNLQLAPISSAAPTLNAELNHSLNDELKTASGN